MEVKFKSLKGRFAGVSDEAISLRAKKGEVVVEKDNLLRVMGWEDEQGGNGLIRLVVASFVSASIGVGSSALAIGAKLFAFMCFRGMGMAVVALVPSHDTIHRAGSRPGKVRPNRQRECFSRCTSKR